MLPFNVFYGLYLLLLLAIVLLANHTGRVVQLYLLTVCGLVAVSL
jgi:hypothetical protein